MLHKRVGDRKLLNLLGHFSLFLLTFFTTLSAEDSFKDFKKSQSESFKKFKDEKDSAFNSYLKQEWGAYNVSEALPLYEKPKPAEIPKTTPQPIKSVGPTISVKTKEVQKVEEKSLEPVAVPKEQQIIITIETKPKDLIFDFYGTKLGFDIPEGIKKANFYPQNQSGISNFFNMAASSEYEALLSEIKKVSKNMNLNDWGVYLLVTKISQTLFSTEDNAKLLSWFIFNKIGYAVKIGLAKTHVVLMHYSQKTIYSTPNYNFGNKKYYVVANYAKEKVGRIFSYKEEYPGSTKPLDLSLESLPILQEKTESKTLNFSQFGNSYSIPITYNKNIIDFMSTYPQADYETFFNAPIDSKTYSDLAASIKKFIDGKKASEAINFVLNFVQKSFKYERDDRQFGREKVMFAQETLYFDKSDCEDRAILFSYLVKELFHINVIGVKYQDHMATALYIPMDGDSVTAESKKFVIADPTYIDANIGMSMPKYKSIKPQSYIFVKKD